MIIFGNCFPVATWHIFDTANLSGPYSYRLTSYGVKIKVGSTTVSVEVRYPTAPSLAQTGATANAGFRLANFPVLGGCRAFKTGPNKYRCQ